MVCYLCENGVVKIQNNNNKNLPTEDPGFVIQYTNYTTGDRFFYPYHITSTKANVGIKHYHCAQQTPVQLYIAILGDGKIMHSIACFPGEFHTRGLTLS